MHQSCFEGTNWIRVVPVTVTSFETIILKATRLQIHRFAKCDCSNNCEIKDTTDKLKKKQKEKSKSI